MEASDNWLDYVSSVGTLLASFAALAAVAITLYLNIWRDRHRRPVLSMELPKDAEVGAAYQRSADSGPTVMAPVNVSNLAGKRSAKGVEVLLSAGYWLPGREEEPPRFYEQLHQEPLTWWISDPPQGTGRATADIPPGITRKAVLLYSGHPVTLYESLSPRGPWNKAKQGERGFWRGQLGVFTVVPLSQETARAIGDQLAYEVRLTVVASDVDAISYRTRLRWRISPLTGDEVRDDETCVVHPVWDQLKRIAADEWPGAAPADTSGRIEET